MIDRLEERKASLAVIFEPCILLLDEKAELKGSLFVAQEWELLSELASLSKGD